MAGKQNGESRWNRPACAGRGRYTHQPDADSRVGCGDRAGVIVALGHSKLTGSKLMGSKLTLHAALWRMEGRGKG